jgi:hypothetical protein
VSSRRCCRIGSRRPTFGGASGYLVSSGGDRSGRILPAARGQAAVLAQGPARRVVVDLGTASAGEDGSTVGNAADCASVPGRVCWIIHAVPASSRPLRGGYGQPAPATVTRSAVRTVTKIV